MEIIKVKNLCKEYQIYEKKDGIRNSIKDFFTRKYYRKVAVNDLNLTIRKGEIVGFLGENGAGKTTTLKMLSGILYPTSGDISVMGYRPIDRNKDFLKRIAFIMGNKNQLLWDLPAKESLNYQKEIYRINNMDYERNLEFLIELFNVSDILNVPIRKLSLGQRMKMELINNFIYRPEVIFLDEPTIGLDLSTQKNIRKFLKQYNKETGATMIITSHYMADIENTSDRIVIMKEGKKIYDNKIEYLLDSYNKEKVLEIKFEGKVDFDGICEFGQIIYKTENKVNIMVEKNDSRKIMKKMINKYDNLKDISFLDIPFETLVERIMLGEEI